MCIMLVIIRRPPPILGLRAGHERGGGLLRVGLVRLRLRAPLALVAGPLGAGRGQPRERRGLWTLMFIIRIKLLVLKA